MTATETWTVGRLLEWTTDYLRKHGSESPRLDAEVLLAHARNATRIQLYTGFAEEPTEAERTTFREMVRRRAEGTPVAYLVAHKEFFSLDFNVGPDCLIPRPETEHLVIAAVDWLKQRSVSNSDDRPTTIVDVCTGSGCVAIALAKQLLTPLAHSYGRGVGGEGPHRAQHPSTFRFLACDISPSALSIARANLSRHKLVEQIELLEGDLLEALPSDISNLDLVVSNPPYVSEAEFAALPKDVREFEPRHALVCGDNGLEISLRLMEQAESRLVVGGAIMLESSPMLIPRLEEAIRARSSWLLKSIIKDLSNRPRIVVAERI
jgi:release factor glutamine methyltransferase